MNDLLSLTIIVRATFFCSEKCEVVLDWFRTSDPWLVIDGVEDLIDEHQRSEVLCRLVSLEQTW